MAVASFVEDLTRHHPFTIAVVIGGVLIFLLFLLTDAKRRSGNPHHPPLPAVPGLPLLGNLLQLKEKKPHKTFTTWAETYGPIYSIRTGSSSVVVINSIDVAKEAMVTKYASISTRKLPNAIKILTLDKCLVAISDYNDFHKMAKRCILSSVLGANAQKRHRVHRDVMMENMIRKLESQEDEVNFREIFEPELFALALKQAIGRDVESIHVDEIGTTLRRSELYDVLVSDPMNGAIDVDWRDFFPYLKWIPNRRLERKIWRIHTRRLAVMKALIQEQKRRIADGERRICYLDFLLFDEEITLSEEQIAILVWEAIIEASDTVSVTTEWAMYELANDRNKQEILFREMQNVCGSAKIFEENLPQLPYLNAVFHETLRNHSPVALIPLRYVHEDVVLGGFHVPAGSEIAVNIYGCNMDRKLWKDPEEWKPERFLEGKYDGGDLYKTMSFGAGKRACAGSLQAMLISCTSIGRFIQQFAWSLGEGEEGNVSTVSLTTRKLQPLRLMAKPRT